MVQRKITACVIDNVLGYESSFEVRIPVEYLARLNGRAALIGIQVDQDTGFPTYVPQVNQFAVERLLSGVGREDYVTFARYLQAAQVYDTEVATLIEELANSLSATSTLTRDMASHMDILAIRAVFRENPAVARAPLGANRIVTVWNTFFSHSTETSVAYTTAKWEELASLPLWFRQAIGAEEGRPMVVHYAETLRNLGQNNLAMTMLWFAINCKTVSSLAKALSAASAEGFGSVFCKMSSTLELGRNGESVVFTLLTLKDGFNYGEVKDYTLLTRLNQPTGGSVKPIVKANFHRRLRNTKPPKGTEKP